MMTTYETLMVTFTFAMLVVSMLAFNNKNNHKK